jgi:hypothetical protein
MLEAEIEQAWNEGAGITVNLAKSEPSEAEE